MSKIKKFPIGTLVKLMVRSGGQPRTLLGLVIDHVEYKLIGAHNHTQHRCEIYFGPNAWLLRDIMPIPPHKLYTVSRTYTKEKL